jgi:hypothetical protein
MTRTYSTAMRGERTRATLMVSTLVLLCSPLAAQKQTKAGSQPSGPPVSVTGTNQAVPKNKLRFPSGVQTFERSEFIRLDSDITVIPGWSFQHSPTMVEASVTHDENGLSRPGSSSLRWLVVDDLGGGANEGFTTPAVEAPSPWNYRWQFSIQVGTAPTTSIDAPTFAIQHAATGGFQDAFGVRLTPAGAELFTTNAWGSEQAIPVFAWSGLTDIGEWIDVRVDSSLLYGTLRAFVNGTEVGMIRSRPPVSTDVTEMRFTYHGGGSGNATTMHLDDVGVAFTGPVCEEDLTLDFTTEDDVEISLVNGQRIDDPPEFGRNVFVSGDGITNRGTAIFDSDPLGPNATSQDPDLLVNNGNVLILQTDAAANPDNALVFPRPNDDEDGGTMFFDWIRPVRPLSLKLIDIDDGGDEGAVVTLTDYSGETRTYTVPIDWTGEGGMETLDLTITSAQAPNGPAATGVDSSLAYDPNAIVSMTVELLSSGAVDDVHVVIPCELMAFEVEDDDTPVFSGTTLADGQMLTSPPEFENEFDISDAGPNQGAAIFDSTIAGQNDFLGAPDRDLCVGLGNILILQNNLFPAATGDFFDIPNDDTQGGSLFFDFVGTAQVNRVTLIDVDEEESVGVTVTLTDKNGFTRVYTVPIGWTEDLLNDGPPGFGVLDLTDTNPQAGYDPPGPITAPDATCVSNPNFDQDEVVNMTIDLGGAQAVDNICFCPYPLDNP